MRCDQYRPAHASIDPADGSPFCAKRTPSLSRAASLAKFIYLAGQFISLAKRPHEHYTFYFRLTDEFLKRAPSAKPYVESINNRILTGEPV
jgi:hypothetical protein